MKKLLFLLWLLPFLAKSQDVITLKNGEEINAKITEVGTEEIKYKKGENDVLYIIKKSEIFMIKYKDGTKDIFKSESGESKKEKTNFTDQELRLKGAQDAEKFYRGNKCGAGGVMATSLLASPLIGLIPAIACSSTPPEEINLRIPTSTTYSANSTYIYAYKDQSHRIKKKKIWTTWGVSVVINLVIIIVLLRAAG
jgi:molybdopterin-binding protein